MSLEPVYLPSEVPFSVTLVELPADCGEKMQVGPNDSSIHRGDREDTGDDEAQPTETGSGPARPTADPTSLGGTTSIRQPASREFDAEEELQENDGMEVMEPTDGRL